MSRRLAAVPGMLAAMLSVLTATLSMLVAMLAIAGATISGWGPAPALASAGDVATTHSYVSANYTLVHTATTKLSIARTAIERVLANVTNQCPQAAAGSPQNEQSTQMSNEVIGTMVTSAIADYKTQIAAYVRVAERSRWSSGGLTGTVHAYASKLKTMASLPIPDICADVRAWVASGYRTLPPGNVRFAPQFMSAWVALGELPSGLSQFERPEDRSLASSSMRSESELNEFEAVEVEKYTAIMNELGVQP